MEKNYKNFDITNAIKSVRRPKMKRDAGVKAVFLLRKKTALTPASLFIFGRQTEVTVLEQFRYSNSKRLEQLLVTERFFNLFLEVSHI